MSGRGAVSDKKRGDVLGDVVLLSASSGERVGKGERHESEFGNVGIVKFLVRYPCFVFLLVLFVCCCVVVLGVLDVLGSGGSLLTPDTNSYDLGDGRSVAYDAFRLARIDSADFVRSEREDDGGGRRLLVSGGGGGTTSVNNEDDSRIFFVFESEGEEDLGLFTAEGLAAVRNAEGIVRGADGFGSYCAGGDGSGVESCDAFYSATLIYYASVWAQDEALRVMDLLDGENRRELYNEIMPCVASLSSRSRLFECRVRVRPRAVDGGNCSGILERMTMEEWGSVCDIREGIEEVVEGWDGNGVEQISGIEDATRFIRYLLGLKTERSRVEFFVDGRFEAIDGGAVDVGSVGGVNRHTRSIGYFSEVVGRRGDFSDVSRKDWLVSNVVPLYEGGVVGRGSSWSRVLDFYYLLVSIAFDLISELIFADSMLVLVSFFLIFAYMWLILGSLFLSVFGMIQIMLSLVFAFVFYRQFFSYFSPLNALALFVSATIGADDIFVMMGHYESSGVEVVEHRLSFSQRMSVVLRKSMWGMGVTSASTICAFFTTCISPFATTCSFGVFSALVVFFDYVLVLVLFSSVLVVYHDRFENVLSSNVGSGGGLVAWLRGRLPTCNCEWGSRDVTPTLALRRWGAGVLNGQGGGGGGGFLNAMFLKAIDGVVQSLVGRVVLFFVLFAWIGFSIFVVSGLEVAQSSEQYLPADHSLQRSVNILLDEFPLGAGTNGLEIFFVWGLLGVDRGGVNLMVNPNYVGKVKYDDEFVYDGRCRERLREVCEVLRYGGSGDDEFERDRERFLQSDIRGFKKVECSVGDEREEFQSFAVEKGLLGMGVKSGGKGGEGATYAALQVFSPVLRGEASVSQAETDEHFDGLSRLRDGIAWRVGDACGGAVEGGEGVLLTDLSQRFVFARSQSIYVESTVGGVLIGLGVVIVVLLVSTQSVLISMFGFFSILCSALSVVSFFVLNGFTLGVVESILFTLLSGLGVDYLVHLAEGYSSLKGSKKVDRVSGAFSEVGVAGFHGMVTSVLGSIPLFFCTIRFFTTFGFFLLSTILCAWVFGNVYFMALVRTFGSRIRVHGLFGSGGRRVDEGDDEEDEGGDGDGNGENDDEYVGAGGRGSRIRGKGVGGRGGV